MKILLVQDHLRSGGTERQSVLLANAFAAAGHPTTLLTFRPGGSLAATVGSAVARGSLQPTDLGLDWFAPGLVAAARRLAPDIVLCMGRMANCYAGRLQTKLPRAAVVATLRTGKPLPWLFRRSLRLVRHVVANSRDARDTLVRRHAVPADKITVIHNSLVFPALAPETPPPASPGQTPSPGTGESVTRCVTLSPRDQLRRDHHATATTTVLLCVAMFRPEKNQRELIAIAGGLPASLDWQLWLAGDGPARPDCERLVAGKNLAARVKFPGFLRDPSPLYAAADVAVHASSSESLSNFLIEAQAHGLPGVAYEAQGIAECWVPDRTGWTIARGNRDAFRSALVRLATTPAGERASRAAEARAHARITFDPARQVATYLDLFTRLAPTPSRL